MSPTHSSMAASQRGLIGMRLDVVQSYLRNDDGGKGSSNMAGFEDFPKRAYSVGSKPTPGKTLMGGSSYVDMSGSTAHARTAKKEAEKSCSAPHLNDENQLPTNSGASAAAAAAGEVGDLFMELDFNHRKTEHQVGSVKDFRDRASSGGSKDLSNRCSRTLSYSAKDALTRITFFRPLGSIGAMDPSERRPRTSTICQESLRPRTSSFGANVDDSRPRSSSGGNARLRDVFGQEPLHRMAARSSAAGKQFSVESSVDSLNAGADYTDMFPGGASGVQRARSGQDLDEYVPMVLGEMDDVSESDYMPMRPGEMTASSTVSDYMMMGSGTVPRKESSKPPSDVVSVKSVEFAPKSADVSDYMSMRPGELSAATNSTESAANYMSMAPASASPPSSQLSTDCHSQVAGGGRKLSSSVPLDNPTAAMSSQTFRMPFELEASLLSLHYAAPDTAASSSAASATVMSSSSSSTSRTGQNSSSPYARMSGPFEIGYASLELARRADRVQNEPLSSAAVARTLPSIIGGHCDVADTARCSRHVYAEIDFGCSDKSRPST